MTFHTPRTSSALTALSFAIAMTNHAAAQETTTEARAQRGAEVIRSLNKGKVQPTLEAMRSEFPFLAEATEAYALGDVWSRPGPDMQTRQLAAVAVMASIGETGMMRVHAAYALNIGVTENELKEVIYMITVPAGFPRAIVASQVLSDLFQERRAAVDKSPASERRHPNNLPPE